MRILRLIELLLFVSLIISIVLIDDHYSSEASSESNIANGNNTKEKKDKNINYSFIFTNSNIQ